MEGRKSEHPQKTSDKLKTVPRTTVWNTKPETQNSPSRIAGRHFPWKVGVLTRPPRNVPSLATVKMQGFAGELHSFTRMGRVRGGGGGGGDNGKMVGVAS